jgi:hypothetical protein
MDSSKQAEEMVRTWAEVQRKMWESWLTPMKGLQGGGAASEYSKALETWEASVKKALDAQVEWTRMWAEGMTAGQATSEVAVTTAKRVHEMMRIWTDSHKQLWENWFTTLRQLDPSRLPMAGEWEKEAQKVTQIWQDAAKAAQQAMAEWTALWAKRT